MVTLLGALKIKTTMKKSIFVFLLVVFVLGKLNAQLTYPKKDCEGAAAIPDDLISWCLDKYYNQCECSYEKAIERYEAEKNRLDQKIKRLSAERTALDARINKNKNEATQLAFEITRSDYSGAFNSNHNYAISLMTGAVNDAKEAIAITEEMQQTFAAKNGGSPDSNATKYRKTDLEILKNKLEEIRALTKPEKASESIVISSSSSGNSSTNTSSNTNEEENITQDKNTQISSDNQQTLKEEKQEETEKVEEQSENKTIATRRTRAEREEYQRKQREQELKAKVDNVTQQVTEVLGSMMDAAEQKELDRMAAVRAEKASAKEQYEYNTKLINQNWKNLKATVDDKQLSFEKAKSQNPKTIYAVVFAKQILGAGAAQEWAGKPADYSQLAYFIHYTEPFAVDLEKIEIVPEKEKEELVKSTILKQIYRDLTYHFAFAASKEELSNLINKEAPNYKQTQITFNPIEILGGSYSNKYNLEPYSSRNLLDNTTWSEIRKNRDIARGDKVIYFKNGDILFLNADKFMLFKNVKLFSAFRNLNSHVDVFKMYVNNRNKTVPFVPVAEINKQDYLPSMDYFSEYEPEREAFKEILYNGHFQLPKLYYPKRNKIDHLYIAQHGQNSSLPLILSFDYQNFKPYTEFNTNYDIRRPMVAIGTINWSEHLFNKFLNIEGIIEYYPAMKLNEIQKTGRDRGVLKFVNSQKEGLNTYTSSRYKLSSYFGIKAKPNKNKKGGNYQWETSKIRFDEYKIKQSELGYAIKTIKNTENLDAYESEEFRSLTKLWTSGKINTPTKLLLEKDLKINYVNHFYSVKYGFDQVISVHQKAFPVHFFGHKIDLTNFNVNIDANGKNDLTAFEYVYDYFTKLLSEESKTQLFFFETAPIEFTSN